MDPMLWTNGSDRLNRKNQLGAQKSPCFFSTFQHLQVGRKKSSQWFYPKKWCEHRNHEDFVGRNNSPSWNITMMFRSVPQCNPWGADSGIPASKPSHGEKHRMPRWASETFLVFFLGGRGQRRNVEGKTSWDFEVERKTLLFFCGTWGNLCVSFFFQVISYCLKKHDYWEISKERTTIPRESLAIPTL